MDPLQNILYDEKGLTPIGKKIILNYGLSLFITIPKLLFKILFKRSYYE